MKINATLVNPFVEAAMRVLEQVTGVEVRRGQLSYKGKPEPRHGVSIINGVFGYLTGQVIYNMRTEVAEKLVEKMLPEKPRHRRARLFCETIGELANRITGDAMCILNQGTDRELRTTTPAVVTGELFNVTLVSKPTLVFSLHTQCGQVEINVALGENDDGVFGCEEDLEKGGGVGESMPAA